MTLTKVARSKQLRMHVALKEARRLEGCAKAATVLSLPQAERRVRVREFMERAAECRLEAARIASRKMTEVAR